MVHSQVSRCKPDGTLYYLTGVKFLDLTLEAEQTLEAVIRAYGYLKHGR